MVFKFGHTYTGEFDWGLLKDNRRMVFTIPVGDINQDEISAYIREVANNFKNTPIIDASGSMGEPYRFSPHDRDYFIPTRGNFPDITIIDHISLLTP